MIQEVIDRSIKETALYNAHVELGAKLVPFGGYKMSGNGREWGEFGFEDFLEIKAVMGSMPKTA